jgi:hypothetical protein
LVPAFDLSLGLGVAEYSACVLHSFVG